jgi:ankyrin repeat protein
MTIISCFLQHGLDVNVGNGDLLCLAVQEKNVALLKDMLSASPNITTLRLAFSSAASVLVRDVRLDMMELLLWQSDSAEIGQSEALWQLTHTAIAGDSVGLKLLLRHRASVDFDNGSALQIAAHAGSLDVVDLLMASRPTPSSIKRAFLAATASSLTSKQKYSVYEHLLTPDCGLPAGDLSSLLADAVTTLPDSTQLVSLLLARGAEPKLETLKFAPQTCSHGMYILLLSKIKSTHTAVEVFTLVRSKAQMPSNQRYEIYKALLAKNIPKDAISGAFMEALKGVVMNLDLPKLLLEHGAAVSYDNAKGFRLALLSIHSVELFRLLVQHIEDDKTAGVAFNLAKKHAFDDPYKRVEIYRSLLQWNIAESSLSDALEDFLKGNHSDTSVIQLLLRNGADPNKNNARCFLLACATKSEAEFRALSRHANLAIVLQGLLTYFQVEVQVVHWFNICLEERPHGAKIANDQLLFQCLNKFPKGATLLKLLLDNGVSAAAMKQHNVCAGKPSEQCTALIWALLARPRIKNDVILVLLSRGGGAGSLYFSPDFP